MRVLIPILEAQIEVPVLKTAINSTFQEVGFEARARARAMNITYSVKSKLKGTLNSMLAPVVDDVVKNKQKATRCIIFCATYDITFEVFQLLATELGKQNSLYACTKDPNPPGEKMKYRLVDKYDVCTGPKVKANIVKSFGDPNGSLCVVVATIAFGMGMDCQNIRYI